MKKIILLLVASLFIIGTGSYAQQTAPKTKTTSEKSKTKSTDGKTKVKDDKWKTKDAAGNKTKIKAPAPVLKSFTTDYPDISDATWTNTKGNWSASYKVNGMKTTTTYHANGTRIDTRTMYPLDQLPQAVITYQQNNAGYTPTSVILISRSNQPDIYEVKSSSGTIYIDTNGAVTTYTPDK